MGYLFLDDAALRDSIYEVNTLDVVLEYPEDAVGKKPAHPIYDCVNQMSETTAIYAIDTDTNDWDLRDANLSDEFLFWGNALRDDTSIISTIENMGYEVTYLGSNHMSQVYVCTTK